MSNSNVATFIKELVLEPVDDSDFPEYQPGQYIQLDIPAYDEIKFSDFDVPEPYASVWNAHHVFDYKSSNPTETRRNYSLATAPGDSGKQLRFNVRIATPPRGQDCNAGIGSSYVHHLKPGDTVTAIGPFGDFLIKDTDKEIVYLGGGAGMAPLRSHISHLFETLETNPQSDVLVRRAVETGNLLRGLFPRIGAAVPEFCFSARALGAIALRQLARAHWLDS